MNIPVTIYINRIIRNQLFISSWNGSGGMISLGSDTEQIQTDTVMNSNNFSVSGTSNSVDVYILDYETLKQFYSSYTSPGMPASLEDADAREKIRYYSGSLENVYQQLDGAAGVQKHAISKPINLSAGNFKLVQAGSTLKVEITACDVSQVCVVRYKGSF